MPITLGYVPAPVTVNLTVGADFVQTLTTADGSDFPAGAAVSLVFGNGTVWPATVSGSTVTWDVPAATVSALQAGNPQGQLTVRVTYTDSTGADLVWMSGWVAWHD